MRRLSLMPGAAATYAAAPLGTTDRSLFGCRCAAGKQHKNPCAAPEYHRPDFILGSWYVVDASNGSNVAELEIEPVTESDCGFRLTARRACRPFADVSSK